jgi:retron-type reverse transcriptase
MIFEEKQKSQPIERRQVWNSFIKVRRDGGASGVDKMSIEQVSAQPRKYLYPIWNRLASDSYFPKPVREVEIPKTDGRKRKLGTPQGGVISPLLANIFLHFVFDKWIEKYHPEVKFERYADDIILHCQNFKQAMRTLEAVKARFKSNVVQVKNPPYGSLTLA